MPAPLSRRQFLRGAIALGVTLTAHSFASPASARTADFAALAASIDGRLVLPGDADYAVAHQLFQPRYDTVSPAAVAYPAHDQDIVTCLAFAQAQHVPLVPRGGGHSYAGWSTGPGLVLDLSALSAVGASTSGTATVGAGARLADVNATLASVGAAVPSGLCPSVSVTGLTLGGGLGVTSRAYGTTSDNLTGARIVTVDGRIREVGPTQDSDLFWALRGGGGGNFGIVTELRLTTHPTPDCAHAELHWAWSDAGALIRAWQRWAPALPDHLWSQLEFDVYTDPPAPYVGVLCLDGADELNTHLDGLIGLAGVQPSDRYLVVRSYSDTMQKLSGCLGLTAPQCHLPGTLPGRDPNGQVTREDYASRSDFWTAPLPEAGIGAVLDAVAHYATTAPPGGHGVVQFDGTGGGAVNRIAPQATAFVHRDALFLAQYLAYWPEDATPDEVRQHQAWLGGLWTALRPWASGQAYQNYVDPRLTTWREAYYSSNLPRLQQIKAGYDPGRVLDFPQAI
ncbi:FAD/FMN-containing dehydrogenase [Streptacidiphilus sp. MAP12-20]|uniref:FAD-binding oxidoreductase n=1 Tax=Streptacidiphilus sp. MAP12-20 TaxID=3156299 RepID=UPI003510E21A